MQRLDLLVLGERPLAQTGNAKGIGQSGKREHLYGLIGGDSALSARHWQAE